MLKLSYTIKLTIALVMTGFSPLASAQDNAATCPPDAEQRLYTMVENIKLGKQKDVPEVTALAAWAVKTCPNRRDVQSMATSLYSALARASNDLDVVSERVTQMHLALQQEYIARTPKDDASKVLKADGSEFTYFAHKQTGGIVPNVMLPLLVALGERGKVHPLVSGAPLSVCPYPKAFDGVLEDEAEFWKKQTARKEGQPVFTWAANRLRALRDACPEHAYDLNYYLSRLYGEPVYRLTDYDKSHNGMSLFGKDMWKYTLRADGAVYEFESSFEKAYAVFLEQARPLAGPLAEYLKAYKAAADAEAARSERDDSYGQRRYLENIRKGRNADASKWEKAVASFAAE